MPYTLILVQHDEGDEIYRAAKDKFGNMVLGTMGLDERMHDFLPPTVLDAVEQCRNCAHFDKRPDERTGRCKVASEQIIVQDGTTYAGWPLKAPTYSCERFEPEPPF